MSDHGFDGELGIIGGGIVGLAFAREFLRRHPAATVTVLEKEAQVGEHQTGHNSGVVHAGIYYEPGSLKAHLCTTGARRLRDYCAENDIAYDECGKVIVAAEASEIPALEELYARGRANGVPDLRMVGPEELREIEPHVVGIAALHSPRTAIVDYGEVARSFAASLRETGAHIRVGCEVTGIRHVGDRVHVRTTSGVLAFDRVVGCAGLSSDHVARLAGDTEDPKIVPFRGEYWMLKPERRHLVKGLIYPVPDPSLPFLGVHLTKRIDGEVLIGPNAVLAFAREGYRRWDVRPRELWETLRWVGFRKLARRYWRVGLTEMRRSVSRVMFVKDAQRYVPSLSLDDVMPADAGVRAQAVNADGDLLDDFSFSHVGRVMSVRNAPSPAATSSLTIAETIADAIDEQLSGVT